MQTTFLKKLPFSAVIFTSLFFNVAYSTTELPVKCPTLSEFDKQYWAFDKSVSTNSMQRHGKFLTAMWTESKTVKQGYIHCKYTTSDGKFSFIKSTFIVPKPTGKNWELSGENLWNCTKRNKSSACRFR